MISTTKLQDLLIQDNGFVFDQATGYTYNLTMVGIDILKWLKEGFNSEDRLLQRIVETYDVDSNTASRDLTGFLRLLKIYGLVDIKGSEIR